MQNQKIITVKLQPQKREKKRNDKQDHATMNLVLDNRTRLILFNLIDKKEIDDIKLCINSGKEANVYLASKDQQLVALKIYATSILAFKKRSQYIEGDRRFAQMNSGSSNSRRLVKLWAEKEFRNINRVINVGCINVPKPLFVEDTIFAMEFLGNQQMAAPRLSMICKYLSLSRLNKIYYSILRSMRDLFQKAGLVHGDLSEYNLLFWEKKIIMIDVGQAMEAGNPYAVVLLRIDIRNVNMFFARMGIKIVNPALILSFIISPGSPPQFDGIGQEPVHDCMCPEGYFVSPNIVQWIKDLKAQAEQKDYFSIKQDDEFVSTKIMENIRDLEDGKAQIMNLSALNAEYYDNAKVEIKDKKPHEKRILDDFDIQGVRKAILMRQIMKAEGMGSELLELEAQLRQEVGIGEPVEGEAEEIQNAEGQYEDEGVDLNKLNRNDYTKEEWKHIQKKLKEQKRELRMDPDRKSKDEKQRERILAKRKGKH